MLLLLAACSGQDAAPRQAPKPAPTASVDLGQDRPNIVFILSDDQTALDMEWMPKTRRLIGEQGATFANMISNHPNCCPARAQILSGQYAQNNGVRTNGGPHGGWANFDTDNTLPQWLQEAGYATALTGKYLHGYDTTSPVDPGWDHFWPIVGPPPSNYRDVVQVKDGEVVTYPRSVYHTTLVAEQSEELIAEFAAQDKPFFLWSSYIAPHGSCDTTEELDCSGPPLVEEKYEDVLSDVRLPSLDSPSYNERDISDKPEQVTSEGSRKDADTEQRLFTARIRSLQSLDDAVERTVQALDAAGELENTVIMFSSDNGYMFGEHRLDGKVVAYEESLRVPLLVRGPGVPTDVVRDQTAATVDFAATFMEIAGGSTGRPSDGQSVWGWATLDITQADRALLVQAGSRAKNPRKAWRFRAVRTNNYTFTQWRKPDSLELYDRRRDPHQLSNVADEPGYAEVQERLQRLLRQLGGCAGDTCVRSFE